MKQKKCQQKEKNAQQMDFLCAKRSGSCSLAPTLGGLGVFFLFLCDGMCENKCVNVLMLFGKAKHYQVRDHLIYLGLLKAFMKSVRRTLSLV